MDKTELDECPNCGSELVIYKGWASFFEESVEILSGAKWHCPECDKTGKLDGDILVG